MVSRRHPAKAIPEYQKSPHVHVGTFERSRIGKKGPGVQCTTLQHLNAMSSHFIHKLFVDTLTNSTVHIHSPTQFQLTVHHKLYI